MHYALVNESPEVPSDAAMEMAMAVSFWLQDVACAWQAIAPSILFYEDVRLVPKSSPIFVLKREAVSAGVFGAHWEDAAGRVTAEIYTAPILEHGSLLSSSTSVSATLAHEAGEAFRDPTARLWAVGPRRKEGWLYAAEIADPVQGDSYEVTVGEKKVSVSNFVTPAWFDPAATAESGAVLDWLRKLREPFTHSPGGYMLVSPDAESRNFVFDEQVPTWRREHVLTRGRRVRAARG